MCTSLFMSPQNIVTKVRGNNLTVIFLQPAFLTSSMWVFLTSHFATKQHLNWRLFFFNSTLYFSGEGFWKANLFLSQIWQLYAQSFPSYIRLTFLQCVCFQMFPLSDLEAPCQAFSPLLPSCENSSRISSCNIEYERILCAMFGPINIGKEYVFSTSFNIWANEY